LLPTPCNFTTKTPSFDFFFWVPFPNPSLWLYLFPSFPIHCELHHELHLKIRNQFIFWRLVPWRIMKLKGCVLLKRIKTLKKNPYKNYLY
jgi:hypothetical protein